MDFNIHVDDSEYVNHLSAEERAFLLEYVNCYNPLKAYQKIFPECEKEEAYTKAKSILRDYRVGKVIKVAFEMYMQSKVNATVSDFIEFYTIPLFSDASDLVGKSIEELMRDPLFRKTIKNIYFNNEGVAKYKLIGKDECSR